MIEWFGLTFWIGFGIGFLISVFLARLFFGS